MSTFKSVVLKSRPEADIIPDQTFEIIEKPVLKQSDLQDGQVLFQSLYLSLDPAMRGWIRDKRSYLPPVGINEIMRGYCIGKVIASRSSNYSVGDYVTATSGWTELAILNEKDLVKMEIPSNGRVTDGLGVLGLTGLTAYFGLLEIGQPKEGETVVVSGAAGATGSVVCQIAKLKGCRVVGIAGSDDKIAWLKELGCDEALNYKDAEFAKKFRDVTKNLIDVFFDNVGGEILDLALSRAKPFARFVMCGAISQYNSSAPVGPKNITMVIGMRIRMQGFIVFDFAPKYSAARKELSQWLSEGKLQRKEHVLKGGIEVAPQGLVDLFSGINTGKLLVEIRSPEDASSKL